MKRKKLCLMAFFLLFLIQEIVIGQSLADETSTTKPNTQLVWLTQKVNSFSGHGDDFASDQVLEVVADQDSCGSSDEGPECWLTVVIGVTTSNDSRPPRPLLVDAPTSLIWLHKKEQYSWCQGNVSLYTYITYVTDRNFTMQLDAAWTEQMAMDPMARFAYLVISQSSEDYTTFLAVPVLDNVCSFFFSSLWKGWHACMMLIAPKNKAVLTEVLDINAYYISPSLGYQSAYVEFFAANPQWHRDELSFLTSASLFDELLKVNWKIPVLSVWIDIYDQGLDFLMINRAVEPMMQSQMDGPWPPYMSWVANSYDFPQSSKTAINGTRSLDVMPITGDRTRLYFGVNNIRGGTLEVQIKLYDAPTTPITFRLTEIGINSCSFEAFELQYSWLPDDHPDSVSQFSADFETIGAYYEYADLCELEPIVIQLNQSQPIYSGHGGDVSGKQFFRVAADPSICSEEPCLLVIVVGQLISYDAVFPFLVDDASVENVQISTETDCKCGDGRKLYTMKARGLSLEFTLRLSLSWNGVFYYPPSDPVPEFAFLIYVDELKGSVNPRVLPVVDASCAYSYKSKDVVESLSYILIAKKEKSIITEQLTVTNCDNQAPDQQTNISFSAGIVLTQADALSENFLTSVLNLLLPLVDVNWRTPYISILGTYPLNTCLKTSYLAFDASSDQKTDFTDSPWMTWSENSENFPASSKTGFHGLRGKDIDSYMVNPSLLKITVNHLIGGTLNVTIRLEQQGQLTSLQLSFSSAINEEILYPAYKIEYSWLPDPKADVSSRISVDFEMLMGTLPPDSTTTSMTRVSSATHPTKTSSPFTLANPSTSNQSLKFLWLLVLLVPVFLAVLLLLHRFTMKKKKFERLRRLTTLRRKAMETMENDRKASMKRVVNLNDLWEISKPLLVPGEMISNSEFSEIREGILLGKLPCTLVDPNLEIHFPTLPSGYRVAIKTPSRSALIESFLEEIKLMKTIGYHRYILSLIGCSTDPENPIIVTELCELGNLKSVLESIRLNGTKMFDPENLNEMDFPMISWQIANALEFLSFKGIIHRDIAARNVLITRMKEAKLSDFGLSRRGEQNLYQSKSGCCPIRWTAPEAIMEKSYSERSDVWSFGVLLWEIYSLGAEPYGDVENHQLYEALKNGLRLVVPEDTRMEINKLMASCWEEEPTERPTFTVITHMLYLLLERKPDHGYYLNFNK